MRPQFVVLLCRIAIFNQQSKYKIPNFYEGYNQGRPKGGPMPNETIGTIQTQSVRQLMKKDSSG